MNISQDEKERNNFRSRRKFQSDMDSDLATARDNGKTKQKIEIAIKLLEINMPLEQIATITGLSYDEVLTLYNAKQKELRQQP